MAGQPLERSSIRTVIVFALGGLLSLAFIVATYVAMRVTWLPAAGLLTTLAGIVISIYFMHWLGRRLDAIWAQAGESRASREFVRSVWSRSISLVGWIVAIVIVAILIWIAILVPPNDFATPLEPGLSLIFAGIWFLYILLSLAGIVAVQGDKSKALTRFTRNSIAGAIALSIYFLFPFAWMATNAEHLVDLALHPGTRHTHIWEQQQNHNLEWLRSIAIPTAVSLAFGFLTAYVTAIVWYEYYAKLQSQGLVDLKASRRGRDPNLDDTWFGTLGSAKERVVLSGVTLGGWFDKWERFRDSLLELIQRDSVKSISLILPEPGNQFFWNRRRDEISHDRALDHDAAARLGRAIETIYFALDGPASLADAKRFLDENRLKYEQDTLEPFLREFEEKLEPRTRTYEANESNKHFSTELAGKIASEPEDQKHKVRLVFARGLVLGLGVFDEVINFTPYLPVFEDKDCPKITVEGYSPLGRSITQSVEGTEKRAVWVSQRVHAACIAYRFWRAAEGRADELRGLADIPAWLTLSRPDLGLPPATPVVPDEDPPPS